MKLCLRIVLLFLVVSGTLSQDFDLSDALDDLDPVTSKPREPKVPDNENPKKPSGGGDFDLDLGDAVNPGPETPKKPSSGGGGGDYGLDLGDALGGPDPTPAKPAVKKPNSGGGGSFDDSDLADVGGGDYKPDGGRSGGGADQPQEAGSGQIAGIVSAIGVAILGAASSYFAYQKKKLCFKLQGGVDPESGKDPGTRSEPQVLSNLLRTS